LFKALKNRRGIASCMAGVAGACAGETQSLDLDPLRQAARQPGTAEALRQVIGVLIEPMDRAGYDLSLAGLQARLDPASFTAAWAEGRAMKLEQAIALALGMNEFNPGPSRARSTDPAARESLPLWMLAFANYTAEGGEQGSAEQGSGEQGSGEHGCIGGGHDKGRPTLAPPGVARAGCLTSGWYPRARSCRDSPDPC
jgi:hypothetical protein